MSLFFFDKNNNDRNSPSVTTPDVQLNPMSHATTSISPRAVGSPTAGHIVTKNDKIVVNDGTKDLITLGRQNDGSYSLSFSDGFNQRLLVGPDSTGTEVVKISKAGQNASTATNDQLLFNSSQDVFKIISSGTASYTPPSPISGGAPQVVATIPHGQPNPPAFLVYVNNPYLGAVAFNSPGLTIAPSTVYITNSGTYLLISSADVDATNLYIRFTYLGTASTTGLNAYTWSYKYYILQETAA